MSYGAPGGIRTHDHRLRRAVLYPAELLVRNCCGGHLTTSCHPSQPNEYCLRRAVLYPAELLVQRGAIIRISPAGVHAVALFVILHATPSPAAYSDKSIVPRQ
jgi:hypothetical protein